MALAASLQASGGANAANSPKTSASFTPPANAKLYVFGWCQSAAGISGDAAALTISDSAGLTWSVVTNGNLPAEFSSSAWLWEAQVGASPSAMTVTITNSSLSGSGGAALTHAVVAVTGASTPTVVTGQAHTAVTATGTATLTAGPLPAAATSGNLVLIFAGANDDSGANLGAASGFTSLVNGGGPFETVKAEYSTTFAATSKTFANATDNEGAGVIIVEISEGAGGGGGGGTPDGVAANWLSTPPGRISPAGRLSAWRGVPTDAVVPPPTVALPPYFTAPGTSTPQLLMSAEDWGVLPNAAYNHAGDTTATWDDYFSHRQAQGYNCVQTCIFGYGSVAGFGLDGAVTPEGGDVDGVYPFNTNSNDPNNANNSTWWTRRDNFFAKARTYGFRVILNITTPNINAGTFLNSWTTAQWQAWGTKIGTYLAGPNLDHVLVIVADDYFGTKDAEMNAMLTNMRAAGATQPIAIQWYQETSSRRDIYTGNQPTTTNNFSNQADYNFGYSYNVWYDVTEKMGLENNTLTPIPYITADGTFLNTGGLTGLTDKQLLRRQVWWSLSSGAKGVQVGDNNVWTWPTTALAETQTNTFYTTTIPAITTFFRSLPNWHQLLADTSSQLVTSGRGTHASPLASGGSGGQYLSDTDSYVTASWIQSGANAGTLAVIYMSHASTITIDESKLVAGYTAKWVDPASGATTTTTAGPTYTTVGKPANSDGQNDWVLVLQQASTTNSGTLSASVPLLTSSVTGSSTNSGTTSANTPLLTSSISGTATNTGTVNASVPVLTASVTGTSTDAGTTAAQTPLLTSSITGTATNVGTVSASVPLLTSTITDQSVNTGTLSASVPVLTASMSGSSTNTGTTTAQTPLLTSSINGTATNTGTVNAKTPVLTSQISDQTTNVGTLSANVPVATATITGASVNLGTLSANLPRSTASATGTATNAGTTAATLPMLVGTIVGASTITGTTSGTLPLLRISVLDSTIPLLPLEGVILTLDAGPTRTASIDAGPTRGLE